MGAYQRSCNPTIVDSKMPRTYVRTYCSVGTPHVQLFGSVLATVHTCEFLALVMGAPAPTSSLIYTPCPACCLDDKTFLPPYETSDQRTRTPKTAFLFWLICGSISRKILEGVGTLRESRQYWINLGSACHTRSSSSSSSHMHRMMYRYKTGFFPTPSSLIWRASFKLSIAKGPRFYAHASNHISR